MIGEMFLAHFDLHENKGHVLAIKFSMRETIGRRRRWTTCMVEVEATNGGPICGGSQSSKEQ
jgi:hypothetical protein